MADRPKIERLFCVYFSERCRADEGKSAFQETMESVKCVVMGDGGTGKTCLCLSFAEDRFYGEYVPTVFDNYSVTMLAEDPGKKQSKTTPINLGLWDTAGQEEYDRLRPLSYPGTDAFVVAFSLTSETSLNNVRSRWLPELKRFNPDTPFILVGTKKDLVGKFDNPALPDDMQNHKVPPIEKQREAAQKLADESGAAAYIECSALTQENVKQVFQQVVQTALEDRTEAHQPSRRRRRRPVCSIM